MPRPPFDPQRAAFLLLAGVLAVHSVVVLGMTGACIWNSSIIVAGGVEVNCDPYNRMMSLMSAALAAALAFAGIRGNRDKDDEK